MSNIEKVLKQALATFTKPQLASKYPESLNGLAQAAAKLTGDDVGVDGALVRLHNRGPDLANPVGYISVYEDSGVSVSVFVLKANSVLPLHDHPVMHGVIKVLHGSVRVQSYSPIGDAVRPRSGDFPAALNDYHQVPAALYAHPTTRVRRNPALVLSPKDGCALLTPTENNIHEVSAVDGPSAFLDILAPPYDTYLPHVGPRRCVYFDVANVTDTESTLTPMVFHPNYWSVELPYRGPKITI